MMAPESYQSDPDLTAIEARLQRWRIGYLLCTIAALGGYFGIRAALAVLAGGILSLFHLRWIEREVDRRLFHRQTGTARGHFLWRLLLLAAVIYAIFKLHWLPLGAVLAGLFTPAAAICIEGIWQLGGYLRQAFSLGASSPPRGTP